MDKIREIFATPQFRDLAVYGFWDYLVNLLIFAALATPAFLVFWVFYKNRLKRRRIQVTRKHSSAAIGNEIKNSIASLLILTVIDIFIYIAQSKGYTQIYTDVSQYGWPYLFFSVAVIIVLHDSIFYWVHRFMHHPKIYNIVHKVHHQSTDPSPFAAFSFHPLEAILEGLPYVVFAFLLPVHLIALWAWQLIQVVCNVIAHLGYEIYPKGFNRHWLFKFKAPSTHHNMHHARVHGNYGLYFTWWDKLLKTEFKDYNEKYDEVQERIAHQETTSPSFGTLGDSLIHHHDGK